MFMSSGHWQNTGLARWVSKNLYNYNTNNEKSMNPMKWHLLQNDGDINSVRDSINGFPCRLILVNDGDSPLNEGQQEPTPGNTKDMGIFNFNNDKDNVTSLGLDTDVFPNALSYEVTANSDTSAGAFVPYGHGLTLKAIENGDTIEIIFIDKSTTGNKILVENHDGEITYTRLHLYRAIGEGSWENMELNVGQQVDISSKDYPYIGIRMKPTTITSIKINGVPYKIEVVDTVEEGQVIGVDPTKELEYLQQSFELRYPDSDDVGSDYGYLGLEGEVNYLYYDSNYGLPWTHRIKASYYDTKTFTISIVGSTRTDFTIDEYDENGTKLKSTSMQQGDSITLQENTYSFQIYIISSTFDYILINGVKYFVEQLSGRDEVREPFRKTEFSTDYGLKRVIDWVGNCTDEEFVADYEKYFDKHYLLRYYLLVITLGMVDNLG